MIGRIRALTSYFIRDLATSFGGAMYLVMTCAFYFFFFRQPNVDPAYFIIVIGMFGAVMAFALTLTLSHRANHVKHYPLLTRLHSRVEYITAVFLAAILFAFGLQLLVAIVGFLRNSPDMTTNQLADIPPLWIAMLIFAAAVGLHATDLISFGWSRVYVFGTIAILLMTQTNYTRMLQWVSERFESMGRGLINRGWPDMGNSVIAWGSRFDINIETSALRNFVSIVFWPFQAIVEAVRAGDFTSVQSFAPALILLYAAILYLMAADAFSSKDLHFLE